MKVESFAWGWMNASGKPQEQTFNTPNEAIEEMQSRLGKEYTYERMSELGFVLCRIKVTLEVVSAMSVLPVNKEA